MSRSRVSAYVRKPIQPPLPLGEGRGEGIFELEGVRFEGETRAVGGPLTRPGKPGHPLPKGEGKSGRLFTRALSAAALLYTTGLADARVYPRLRSTNVRAAELVERGDLQLPAAIIASLQTAGRGRGANTWHADAGSLAITIVLPAEKKHPANQLPLRAGLIVRAVIARCIAADCLQVKWPNDLLADGKKLAGILCERVRDADLIGVGVNVTTDLSRVSQDVRRRATTIARFTRRPPERAELAAALAREMIQVWDNDDWVAAFNDAHALNGKTIAVDAGGTLIRGRCEGIDAEGRLIVRDSGGLHRVISGSIMASSNGK